MQCERFREGVSARIDGEDPGLLDGVLDAHLKACADCRGWQRRAHTVTRCARVGGFCLDHDLAASVLAAVVPAVSTRSERSTAERLVAAAGGILLVARGAHARNRAARTR